MKRLQMAVLAVVVMLTFGASVSFADNLDEMMVRLRAESVRIQLMTLEVELLTIELRMSVFWEQYNAFANKIAQLPKDADSCRIVSVANNPAMLANIQQQAGQIVQILERAQALVQAGGVPPEALAKALGSDMVSAMRGVAELSEALARMLKQSEDGCKKFG